jgi:preprotein translocase subunit YajC
MSLMFLHNLVLAQAGGEGGASGGLSAYGSLLPLVLMFGVIYLLLIRPANKQRKQHAEMLNTLKKDDEVVTSGGIYGRIVMLDDKVATLEVADKVKIKILRDRIAGRWAPESAPAPSK